MLSLTFKNLWARKWRSIMTAVAVIFGIALVAGTYVLTDTTNEAFDDIFVGANENTDVAITSKEKVSQDDGSNPAFDAGILGKVKAVEGVRIASGDVFSQGAILDVDGDSTGGGFAPQFIASTSPEGLETSEYSEGRKPEAPNEAALDEAAAERADIELGDQILLVGTGKARPFTLVGLTRLGGASFGGTSIAQVDLPVAQQLTGEQGEFDQITVAAEPDVTPEELRDRITEVVPPDLLVETGTESADRQASEIREGLSFLSIALLAFAAISLFVGSFVIFNVFSITVAQRTREFGMMRTLGAGRSQILRTVLIEGFLIGVFASVFGIFVGIGLAEALSALLKTIGAELPSKALVVAPRTIIVSLLIGVGVTMVSSLLPALRATRVPPIAALSENLVVGAKKRTWLRALISAVLAVIGVGLIAWVLISGTEGGTGAARIGAGAVCVVVAISIFSPQLVRPMASAIGAPLQRAGGLTGQLARENSQRNPSRTAVTSAALMIGIALVSFVTVFASGLSSSVTDVIDQNLKGEIILQGPGGFNPMPPEAVQVAGTTEGVKAASGVRYSNVKIDGNTRALSSVEPETVNEVLEFDWKEGSPRNFAELRGDRAVISEGLSESDDLSLGDTVKVLSKTGNTARLMVEGILASGSLDVLGDIVVAEKEMEQVFGVDVDSFALVKTEPGQDVDVVQDRIDAELEKPFPTVDVLNQQELKDNQQQQINTLLAMIYVLLALAVVVSLVGIVVTLILSIYERTRELGMLRAVGMSRRQVRRMIRYEAVITAVLGAIAGLILGVIFAFLIGIPLEGEGFALSYPVPVLFVILLLTALAGVLAAIYPAHKASKLDVLEAVSYE